MSARNGTHVYEPMRFGNIWTATRIGVITDAHANLPALEAALAAMDYAGCEWIVHTGDAIGIGPHPREVLERLLDLPNATLLMGNHDQVFGQRLVDDPPGWLHEPELGHHRWVNGQLDEAWRPLVAT